MSTYRFEAETARLWMREMRPEDAAAYYELNADPEVLKYTGDVAFKDVEDSRQFLEKYPSISYDKDGYGRWTCIEKSSGELIGWCGLRMQSNGETDLGYRFHKRFWGKGFATESSILSLDYGFAQLPLTNVIARACDENVASINVMQKLKMRFREKTDFNGLAGSVYEISKEEWLKIRKHLH